MPGASAWEWQLLSGGFAAAVAAVAVATWVGRPRVYPNLLDSAVIAFGLAWTWIVPSSAWHEWLRVDCIVWQIAAAHMYWTFLHGQRRSWIERGLRTTDSRIREPNFWRDSLLDRVVLLMCVLVPLATLPGTPWAVPPAAAQAAIAALAVVAAVAGTRDTVRADRREFWLDAYLFGAVCWLTLLLLATLRFRLGLRLAAAGIALRWEVSDVPKLDWLDPRNSLHILRILQEAFANILKHTRATDVRVTTGAADGWVSVTIADNGQGYDVTAGKQQASGGGKGLANQRRRAEAIGAEIAVTSSGAGTALTLRLPRERKRG